MTYLPEAPAPNTVSLQGWVSVYVRAGDTYTPCVLGINPACSFWCSAEVSFTSVFTRDTGLWFSFLVLSLFGFGIEAALTS